MHKARHGFEGRLPLGPGAKTAGRFSNRCEFPRSEKAR